TGSAWTKPVPQNRIFGTASATGFAAHASSRRGTSTSAQPSSGTLSLAAPTARTSRSGHSSLPGRSATTGASGAHRQSSCRTKTGTASERERPLRAARLASASTNPRSAAAAFGARTRSAIRGPGSADRVGQHPQQRAQHAGDRMSFASLLKRLDDAMEEARRRRVSNVTIPLRDMEWLMGQFKRMDAQDRAHYPEHVEMLADAAQKIASHYGPVLKYGDELRRALDYSRPDW